MKSMIKKISVAALSFGMATFALAQKADAKSKSILDAVSAKYKANKNTYFKFAYGTGANGKVSKTQTGIFYTTPSQYKLKIMGIEQIFDGSKVYNISAEDQEVTIAKANGSEMMFSPTNYLNSYKKEYNTRYIGKRTVNGVNADLIELTPVKRNGIKNVYIYVNTTKNQLVKVEQYATNNDVAVIAVSDYKTNQNLSADLFKFNKNQYSNYIITEL
ncbi:outer membrane lipoprotein carrier protein LolA [Chryseobacterium taklimakanense]|uniref:LolA family protein n=1 Tax=Chryseobacterium taklimakanense TaxID=536441 RepID=UPI001EF5CEE6|nr:outer membrane lipoprotein carrier protein LolA [Chryseobacterium taklimakanense]MCG7281868.1 outer membrane lipoprotein carrier protein LolA [Chryseobacterium taklimakanense]